MILSLQLSVTIYQVKHSQYSKSLIQEFNFDCTTNRDQSEEFQNQSNGDLLSLIEIYCKEAFSSDWLCQLLGWHIF